MRKILGDLKSLFYALPKVELHVHLGGAYPKHVIREIFEKQGLSKMEAARKVAIPAKFERLDKDFIPLYLDIAKRIETSQDLETVTYETLKKASEDNVKYMELKISNQELDPQGTGDKEEMRRVINKATEQAEKDYGIKVKYIFTLERHNSPESTLEYAKLICKWAKEPGSRFLGFDLAGDEYNFPVGLHKKAIECAAASGVGCFAPHAGESPVSGKDTGVDSIKNCIKLGAERIGHGLEIIKDENLMQEVKEKGIVLEVSPTSNVMMGLAESYKTHPVKIMLKKGLKVSICSDDPAIFNTKLTKEYEHLYKASIINTWDELKQIVMNGVEGAFLNEQEKQELRDEFLREIKLIEDSPYFKEVIEKYLS